MKTIVIPVSGPALKVIAAREEKGLTQFQLAVAAGLSLTTVSLLERGGRMSPLTYQRVAEALGLRLEDLQ